MDIRSLKQKYRSLSLPVKASVWFFICGAMKDVIDVLTTPVFTRILTAEQYGIYNVYNSWFQIVKIFFTLYLYSDVFNVGLVKFEKDRDRFISSTLGFVTASVGFFLLLYLVFRQFLAAVIGLPEFLILLFFVHVLTYVPYYCWIRRERFDFRYRQVAAVSLLYIILQPLLGILAILYLDIPVNPGYTRIVTAVGVQIVIGIILYIHLMSRGKAFFRRDYWKYSFRTGIELVPYNLSKVVLNQSDRIMINHYSGSGETGIYSVAHSAAFVLQVLTEALNGAFIPWLYQRMKARQWQGIKSTVNVLLLLVAAGAVGIEMIAPEMMRILGDEAYYQGVRCIPALVYSVYLIFIYSLFTNIELFYSRNVAVTAVSTVGMAVNIILNAVFIPLHGFVAAGYTTMASYIIICIGHYFLMRKCLKEENTPFGELIDLRFLLVLSVILIMVTLSAEWLYQWTVLRWVIASLIAVAVALSWKKWKGLLKGGKTGNGEM